MDDIEHRSPDAAHPSRRHRIAMVAHDNCKADLLDWARYNQGLLARLHLIATGTTDQLLARELALPVELLRSGPLGGDLQIGARVAEGGIDLLLFFWDPLDFVASSPLLGSKHQ